MKNNTDYRIGTGHHPLGEKPDNGKYFTLETLILDDMYRKFMFSDNDED